MIKKLIIATANKHKLSEIEAILKDSVKEILPMPFGVSQIEENGETFMQNSLIKARAVYNETKIPSLADDSGLCINALNGKPGLYSARYGGENLSYEKKMRMILEELKDKEDKTAYFITSAVCVLNEKYYIALEGRVYGKIIDNPRGFEGFGYDPIFMPNGFNITYAEMPVDKKNSISHRFIAISKMKEVFSCIYEY